MMKQSLTVDGLAMVFNLPQLTIQGEDVDIKLTGGDLDTDPMGDYTIAYVGGVADVKGKVCEFMLEVSVDDDRDVYFHDYVSNQLGKDASNEFMQYCNDDITVDFD